MKILEKYFADFTPEQTRQFQSLEALYADWNQKINVISRKDIENFYLNHVLHSLSIAAIFEIEKGAEVLDLGTGGGFPGIPLAIFFPEVKFHLVDSINKKLNVVRAVAEEIGLQNITVTHKRADEIRDKKYDLVVSRAVAPLKDLWQWSKPLLKRNKSKDSESPRGMICLKGGDLTTEIFESGCKPQAWEVENIFPEPHFHEKYLLYQPI